MAVPKKKISKSRRNMRRSHDKLKIIIGNTCSNCNSYKLCHQMCEGCGFYRGKLIKAPFIKSNPQ
jgi:large subunit ribosomal protein L32